MLRIGTRASMLAKTQSGQVAEQLRGNGVACKLVEIGTSGDQDSRPIAALGVQGVFTKEIQQALLRGEIDVAVHSMKDLPTALHPELTIGCVPLRANPFDVVVCAAVDRLDSLPKGARIGTGSPRRQAQLLAYRSDLRPIPIRGNIDTRLKKLETMELDAIVLAAAGLERVGRLSVATEILPSSIMMPAVGQGALALEIRRDDDATSRAIAPLHDPLTAAATIAERHLLATLQGGCLAPVAAWAHRVDDPSSDLLALNAIVLALDGSQILRGEARFAPHAVDAETAGQQVARSLRQDGADRLVERARSEQPNDRNDDATRNGGEQTA